jgi:hypothetical protein
VGFVLALIEDVRIFVYQSRYLYGLKAQLKKLSSIKLPLQGADGIGSFIPQLSLRLAGADVSWAFSPPEAKEKATNGDN